MLLVVTIGQMSRGKFWNDMDTRKGKFSNLNLSEFQSVLLKIHLHWPGFEVRANFEMPLPLFPREKSLREAKSILHYTCVACIVIILDSNVTAVSYLIQSDTKKRELLKNTTKIEEIQEQKFY